MHEPTESQKRLAVPRLPDRWSKKNKVIDYYRIKNLELKKIITLRPASITGSQVTSGLVPTRSQGNRDKQQETQLNLCMMEVLPNPGSLKSVHQGQTH